MNTATTQVAPSQPAYEERAITIAEFCVLERMSLSTYHKLKKKGLGPSEVKFPGMAFTRVTAQARRDWHARIEQERQNQAAKLEQERRSAQAKHAGDIAAQSPRHVSKRRQRGTP